MRSQTDRLRIDADVERYAFDVLFSANVGVWRGGSRGAWQVAGRHAGGECSDGDRANQKTGASFTSLSPQTSLGRNHVQIHLSIFQDWRSHVSFIHTFPGWVVAF